MKQHIYILSACLLLLTFSCELFSPNTNEVTSTYNPVVTITYDASLPVENGNMTIQWTVSDADSPTSEIEFQTYLENYDDSWSSWSFVSSVTYEGINDGEYIFKVKAMDPEGNESAVSELKVTVLRSSVSVELFPEDQVFNGSSEDNADYTAFSQSPLMVKTVDGTPVVYNFSPVSYQDVDVMLEDVEVAGNRTFAPWTKTTFNYVGEGDYSLNIPEMLNPVMEKISQIETLWSWVPHNYNPDNNDESNWNSSATGLQLRRYYIMNFNMAYYISSDRFEGVIRDNADNIIYNNSYASADELIEGMRSDTRTYRQWIVRNVSGLGGGDVHGVANHVIETHVDVNDWLDRGWSGADIWFHELSHCHGFGHDSNMTYGQGEIDGVNYPEIPQLIQNSQVDAFVSDGDVLFPPSTGLD